MIEIFIFFVLFLATGVGLKHWVYNPFANGTMRIDPHQYPTLARTQRILRARNVKLREKEQKALEESRRLQSQKALKAIEYKSATLLLETQKEHQKSMSVWTSEFNTLMAPEIEREQAERQQAERAAWEERRNRERKIWIEAEAKRVAQQQFLEDKAAKLREEAELLHQQEQAKQRFINAGGLVAPANTRYSSLNLEDDASYGDRKVSVHGVYVRKSPTTKSKILANLTQYQSVSVDGWTTSEELYGNTIWFHLKASDVHPGGWLWSGAVDKKSTSGLRRIEPVEDQKKVTKPRGKFTQNSENAFATLAEMHANPKKYLIAQEIAEAQSEIETIKKVRKDYYERNQLPPLSEISVGEITANKLIVDNLYTQ